MQKIVRVIEWFIKSDSSNYYNLGGLVGEEAIKNFDLEHFKKIFNHCRCDDPVIYGCDYRIEAHHIEELQPYITHCIDLDRYIYFFSTYTDNGCIPQTSK